MEGNATDETSTQITLATIDSDYIKGPITVTSIRADDHDNLRQQDEDLLEEEQMDEGENYEPADEDEYADDHEFDEDKNKRKKAAKKKTNKKLNKHPEKTVNPNGVIKKGPHYIQRFRKEWLKDPLFREWLAETDEVDKAYCTICEKKMRAGKSAFYKHAKGEKHQMKMEKRRESGPPPINHSNVSMDSDSLELSTVLDENGITHVLHIVDLRSDTVTQPSREMKNAMINASLGDDAFSEDPTVKTLEEKVATMLEKEAALYFPSGTMANLACVMAHCWNRGAQVILGDQSNLHVWAQGGIAQIAAIHHRLIKNQPDGTFSLDELQSMVRNNTDDDWTTLTLVCVENTHNMMGGKALPLKWMDELGAICCQMGLLLHCDGARLINAAVALGTNPAQLVQPCDSVSLCLNKGLGAPMGSVLAGSKDFITRAQRIRKMLGGGLHQAGMMAGAGIWGLDERAPKLSIDHANARAIAQCVQEEHSSAITVDLKSVQTNIGLLHCDNIRVDAKKLCQRLSSVTDEEASEIGEQVVVMMMPVSDTCVRFMTHCDVKKEDVKSVVKKLRYVIQEYDNMMYIECKVKG